MTFEDYFIDNNALISLGISFEKPDKARNTMFVLNYCKVENIIQNLIKRFEIISKISVNETIIKNKYTKVGF